MAKAKRSKGRVATPGIGKGEVLNTRVWRLFEAAGFETHPNSVDASELAVELPHDRQRKLDLHARESDLGVTIIGSNKSRKRYESFTGHMADLAVLKGAAGAHGALYVSEEHEVRQNEIAYAEGLGIKVWNRWDLDYYSAVVKAVGKFAKYEIINSFGITTQEQTFKLETLAIRLQQPNSHFGPNTEMFAFTLPADSLLRMCVALRKASGSAYAYQRVVSAKRLPKIGAFLQTPQAMLPTNIVVHLNDDVTVTHLKNNLLHKTGGKVEPTYKDHEVVALTLPFKYASLELIDGQHRLFGFVHVADSVRRRFNLVVLGLKGLTEDQRSETFVAINDNAKRVDANLVAFLRYTNDEKICRQNADLMAIKISVELNKVSPFKDLIRLGDFGSQRLTLQGISGYDLRGLIGPKGLLRQYYPAHRSKAYVKILRIYFSQIKNVFKKEWADPKTFIVRTNRGISAFLKLLRSILKTERKKLGAARIKKYLVALKKHSKTWEIKKLREELQTSYVGSQGWSDLHREMVKRIQKEFPDFIE